MRLSPEFDLLDIYMSVYGECFLSKNILKIYLKDGLGVPPDLKEKFSRRYFYDPWSGNKYSEIRKIDGLLKGRLWENGTDLFLAEVGG